MNDRTDMVNGDASADDSGHALDLLHAGLFDDALVEAHAWRIVRDDAGAIRTWRLVDANATALQIWGRTLEEVQGRTAEALFPDAAPLAEMLPVVSRIMASGAPGEWEPGFDASDRRLRRLLFPSGEVFLSIGFDVSADDGQSSKLERTAQRLKEAIRAGGVGLWDWDLRTGEVWYSDEWKAQLCSDPASISCDFEEWRSRVHPDDIDWAMEQAKRAIDEAWSRNEAVFRMRHEDGSYRWILAQSSVVVDESGTPIRLIGSHIDITERRRVEDRLLQTQRLDSIGTLAAGIAHDFNNLLTAITGNLSLARELEPDAPLLDELLGDIEAATERAQGLTGQLLTFSKGGAPARELASIGELLVETISFVTRGSQVRPVFDVDPALASVEVDRGQIAQVVDNIVINALQAMLLGGELHVEASNEVLVAEAGYRGASGPHVRVSIRDEGPGIPADVLPRIFDPFFTTKSSGNGLGLSTAYAIVARHGGHLAVSSEEGQGTTFHMRLPAATGRPSSAVPERSFTGSSRCLVMDDDKAVRTLFRRILQHAGHSCEVAADGSEAVELWREARAAQRPFDVVILDLTVPGGHGGVWTLRELRALDPEVRAIVTSGYADDDVMARYREHGFVGRLPKPVDLATITAELARVLA